MFKSILSATLFAIPTLLVNLIGTIIGTIILYNHQFFLFFIVFVITVYSDVIVMMKTQDYMRQNK
jgi:hypothetical protein